MQTNPDSAMISTPRELAANA